MQLHEPMTEQVVEKLKNIGRYAVQRRMLTTTSSEGRIRQYCYEQAMQVLMSHHVSVTDHPLFLTLVQAYIQQGCAEALHAERTLYENILQATGLEEE